MNVEKAKELLSAGAPDLHTDANPELLEALELAKTNPDLQEWIAKQENLDPRIAAEVSEVPIPEGLEASLLKIVGAGVPAKPKRNWRGLWIAATGIAAVLCLGFLYLSPKGESLIQGVQASVRGTSQDSFDHFRDGMAYYIRNVYFQLDHTTTDLDSIENWLKENNTPVYQGVPEALQALVPIGCKRLDWQGRTVSLVCFHTAEGKIVHMFIMDRDGVEKSRFSDISTVANSNGLETGGWSTDQEIYLLVGSDPEVDVEFALG